MPNQDGMRLGLGMERDFMREIEFRGKRKDNGEWVYGDFIYNALCADGVFIAVPSSMTVASLVFCEVAPETVGQYTGLKDCKRTEEYPDGQKIFGGDIVYLAGYGLYVAEFPFTELYEACAEGDIGDIQGNVYEDSEADE